MAKRPTNSNPTPPKKAAPRKRAPAKRTPAKKRPTKAKAGKPSWLKRMWSLCWKVGLVVFSALVIYGIYLDGLIAQKFEGQRWYLPAQIYARPMSLFPGAPITHSQLKKELALLGYRNTGKAAKEGEYAVAKTRIQIYRRPFDGPNGHEGPMRVMVHFEDNRIAQVQRSKDGRDLGFLQLEPLLLDRILTGEREDRLFVPRIEIPEPLVTALLRTEDQDFYRHHGISISGIARAAFANIKAGKTVQGGSTLTQQLAKNFFLTRDRTIVRKANEALMALIIDARYGKDEILEAYLNEVYMGQDGAIAVHGVGLAAWHYFGTPLAELDMAQQAMLVALVKGPSYYNPWRFPERAQQRRDLILKLMMEQGSLSSSQYNQLASSSLNLRDPNWRQRHKLPGFRTVMQRELTERFGPETLNESGLKVYTTLDPLAQQAAERAVREGMKTLAAKRDDNKLQAAMVVVDRYQGGVLAVVGDKEPNYKGFNRATDAHRPIGSLIKPLLYLTALSEPQQFNLMTPLKDAPISLKSNDGQRWQPQNVDKKYRGTVPLKESMINSLNVPTVNLGMAVGIDALNDTLTRAGWTQRFNNNPSAFLGAMDASPYQMAQLYQTLADGGRYRRLYSIGHVTDSNGNRLVEQQPSSQQVLSENAAWLTNYMLTEVVQRGTAKRLGQQYPNILLAGKTGTTSDGRDAWFAGFDDRDVVVTWVGRDDNSAAGLYGSSAALPLYQRYLEQREPLSLVMVRPYEVSDGYFASGGQAVAKRCRGAIKVPVDQASWNEPSGCSGSALATNDEQPDKKNWFEKLLGL
ncbi:penicillin-binding protein 1B [Ferrimonas lipolytica]|uniref:Penicillin-binding protein 1B n=1 Tax=Ferrimonas lipolytica TaxID=2724191 RepID=A0A6H1UF03_9GAMM|nr:penicillin-binding protein 1B [Ferrimonas lipolytica]QIZ77675.1 penicillin-binding protein 1B [Ferrimonas lipolytica]